MKLLIDGDWLAFSTCMAFQDTICFGGGHEQIIYDEMMAIHVLVQRIEKMKDLLCATEAEMHFSCPREDNWRRSVLPEYKMNREGLSKPIGLEDMKDYCRHHLKVVEVDSLEADDTLSIAATGKDKGNCTICSIDKDFLSIGTNIYNPKKNIIKAQTKRNAFKFFIYQIIVGDASDGYKGIPRVGPKGAKNFIAYNAMDLDKVWEPLVKLAKSKGVDEDYVIQQATMAHLLTADDVDDDYNIDLWTPDKISSML